MPAPRDGQYTVAARHESEVVRGYARGGLQGGSPRCGPVCHTRIHYWRGNPEKRSEMFFYVEFDNGDKVLLPYSKDLSAAAQFEDFVYSEPQLFPLRFNAADAPKRVTAMRKEYITFSIVIGGIGVMTGSTHSTFLTRTSLPMCAMRVYGLGNTSSLSFHPSALPAV